MRSFPTLRLAIIGLCVAVAARFTEHIAAPIERAVERAFDFIMSTVTPAPLRLAADGPDLVRSAVRPSLSAALLESLRHEKGVRNLRAARGI
jgi:hypothetical protein